MKPQRGSDLRALLLVGGVVLIAWSLIVPVFESPDEHLHWQYARYLHDEWRLPVYTPGFAEGNSPPLYYAAVALVATRTVLPPPLIWQDGRDEIVHLFHPRLHLTAADDFSQYWPIRLARLLSAIMALTAAWLCGRAAQTITGRSSTGLLAAGFALFLPQFAFRGTSVSNDVLVTTTSAWLVWMLARWIRDGYSPRIGVLTAVALAAAFLSKISAICLVPAVVLVILTDPASWRARVSRLWVLGAAVLLVLPWSARNVMLYGDPFASGAMHHAVGSLIVKRSFWDPDHFVNLPRELFKSFVGRFGYLTVPLPKWAYALYLAFMLFAVSGVVRAGRGMLRMVLVLLAIVVANYAVVVRINTEFVQSQGRYMFPALPAIVVAMAWGLESWWWRPGASVRVSRLTTGLWAAANLTILFGLVMPAFHPPLVASISRVSTPVAATLPALTSDVRIPAEDARFVMFDLEGTLPIAEASGEVVLTLDRAGDRVEHRLPFRWKPDGKSRKIYLTTLTERDWRGVVVQVRIVPLRENGDASRLRLSGVVLAGSIPTYDY